MSCPPPAPHGPPPPYSPASPPRVRSHPDVALALAPRRCRPPPSAQTASPPSSSPSRPPAAATTRRKRSRTSSGTGSALLHLHPGFTFTACVPAAAMAPSPYSSSSSSSSRTSASSATAHAPPMPLASRPSSREALPAYRSARPRAHDDTSDSDGAPLCARVGSSAGARRRASHGTLRARGLPPPPPARMQSATSDDGAETDAKPITTAPGRVCAGETETEGEDRPWRHLPTSRIVRVHAPGAPPLARLTPVLFEAARLLSVVPALFGTLWNVWHALAPAPRGAPRADYLVSVLWCVLTGYQCLRLATGLLVRWRAYYAPLSTLIRLLGLQAICWPATHFTLTLMGAPPVDAAGAGGGAAAVLAGWAAVGTCTCCSRAVQMWVTSNLVVAPAPLPAPEREKPRRVAGGGSAGGAGSADGSGGAWLDALADALVGAAGGAAADADEPPAVPVATARRWDWAQVGLQCALPAGVCYVVMAWAVLLSRAEGC